MQSQERLTAALRALQAESPASAGGDEAAQGCGQHQSLRLSLLYFSLVNCSYAHTNQKQVGQQYFKLPQAIFLSQGVGGALSPQPRSPRSGSKTPAAKLGDATQLGQWPEACLA